MQHRWLRECQATWLSARTDAQRRGFLESYFGTAHRVSKRCPRSVIIVMYAEHPKLSKVWEVVLSAITAWPRKRRASGLSGSEAARQEQEGKAIPAASAKVGSRQRIMEWAIGWCGPALGWLFLLMKSKTVLLILGGAVGTWARYWLGKWFNEQPWAQGFPYGTFVINVSGSFILAVAAVIILERLPPSHQDWYLLVGTGLCGGYTTFSTFEWETFRLIRDGSWYYALANAFGSVLAGFAAILLAVIMVNGLLPKR